jgi:Uma2 family endonuclease
VADVTTAPAQPPHLLTVAEYLELGEPPWGYDELVEGRVIRTPSPDRRHNRGHLRAAMQIEPQLPPEFEVLQDLDVDLGLTPPDAPGFVRRPDVVVTRRAEGLIKAADVAIVVEFVSPGSVRTDHMVKRSEYADAGVPHYWIVDVRDRPSLIACHLGGEFGYVDGGVVHGVFTTAAPFPLRLDLDALR